MSAIRSAATVFTILITCTLALEAQSAQNLEDTVDTYFTVSTSSPISMSPQSGTFEAAARALHYDMVNTHGYSGTGDITTEMGTSGVYVTWGAGTVSSSQNTTIVLATTELGSGNAASALANGSESAAYAVSGHGSVNHPNTSSGDATATCNSSTDGGGLRIQRRWGERRQQW